MRGLMVASAVLLVGCSVGGPSISAAPTHGVVPQLEEQALAVHGMLMFGSDALVLSHLGLYHSPHQFQILFDATFDGPGAAGAREAWRRDVTGDPDAFHTIVPEPFRLSDVAISLRAGTPFHFAADLVRGHFERGGETIERGVAMAISGARVWRVLNASEPDPPHAVYLLFAAGERAYMAHRIAGSPDFDEIVQLAESAGVSPEEPAREVVATELPGDAQLQAGDQVALMDAGRSRTVTVDRVIYLETRDFQS